MNYYDKNSIRHKNFSLSRGFLFSFIFHFTLICFTLIKLFVFPSKIEHYTPTLRVDVVDLPDIAKKDLEKLTAGRPKPSDDPPPPAPPAPPKVTQTPKDEVKSDEMVLREKKEAEQKKALADKKAAEKKRVEEQKKRTAQMSQALARMKALEKINKLAEENEKEGAVIKGNRISKGSSLTGEEREEAELRYEDLVLEKVKANWTLPPWLANQDLSAQVLIKIDSGGRVIRMSFEKSSGHQGFDDAVQSAIQTSQPFPEPNRKDLIRMLTNGVLLGFPI